MPLDIIGAGLGRTGTGSLKLALDQLGLGPCYHMTELMQQPDRLSHWLDAEAHRPVDWEALFAGYRAAVDYPTSRYWRQLSKIYPDAKVILTVRDPLKWYASVATTIRPSSLRGAEKAMPISMMVKRTIWDGDFSGRFGDQIYSMAVFESHNQQVIDAIDPDRLLIFKSGQGWDPICRFLGVKVPDRPYPHNNTRSEFQAHMRS